MALGWLWWRAWFPVDAVGATALCVAGVALGHIDLHLAWQACLHFAWQAWHLWQWAGSGGALGSQLTRGRRGTWRRRPSLCVAGVALGDIDLHFARQAWHLWHWAGSGGGVALSDIDLHFAWQVWHLATWIVTLRGVALMALGWLWWRAWLPAMEAVTHHPSHTTLSHALFQTQLSHTPSFTHNFVTHTHTPSFFVTHHLSHTTLSHTTVFTSRSFTTNFVFPSFPVPLQHLLLLIGS